MLRSLFNVNGFYVGHMCWCTHVVRYLFLRYPSWVDRYDPLEYQSVILADLLLVYFMHRLVCQSARSTLALESLIHIRTCLCVATTHLALSLYPRKISVPTPPLEKSSNMTPTFDGRFTYHTPFSPLLHLSQLTARPF